jgi:DNA primase
VAGRILKDDIDGLRDRADIVAVVGDHTKLKKAGQRWKGLCPFHSEKTPSFTVDPANNLYYCFGCNEGGDLYDFLMKVEGLDFVEAVEQLARRTGYTLRYEEMSAGQKRALGERSRLVAINRAAGEFFTARLYADEGTTAREYLKERGFGREEAEQFALGYAPNEWEALSRHLQTEAGFASRHRAGRPRGAQRPGRAARPLPGAADLPRPRPRR